MNDKINDILRTNKFLYNEIQKIISIFGTTPTKEELIKHLVVEQNIKIISKNDCYEDYGQEEIYEAEIEKISEEIEKLEKLNGETFNLIIKASSERVEELKKHLLLEHNKNSKRIKIELPGNDELISDFAKKIVTKISYNDELFFREDMRKVVEITNLGFEVIQPNRFITIIEKDFEPWTTIYTKFGSKNITRSMNQAVSNVVIASQIFQNNLKLIKRIFPVQIPIVYNGKLTFPDKGYDERFYSWTNKNSPTINPKIPLEEVKEVFYKIFNEFCFQDKQDYVNAIAGFITPFLRGLFSDFNVRTPMFCYMANRERAGKDYCAGITGLILEGFNLEEPPISSGEYNSSGTNDELRKKIVSALMSGKKRLHFANNKGKLNNAVLEGFLTSKIFSDRILGKNDSPNFNNEMDVSLSGNIGMTFTPDLANRSRFINLFLDIEDANQRGFKNPNLHKWVLENRDYIISCIYSLIKHWFDKGCPKGSIAFASFPEWAEICGGIMECSDLGNPCVKDEKNTQGISLDEDTDEMKSLFEYLFEKKPNEWLSKQDIKNFIKISPDNLFSYMDWDNRSNQSKFGRKIDKYVGRVLSDIRLIVQNISIRSARRKYKLTKEKANFDKKLIFGSKNVKKDGNMVTNGNISTLSAKSPIREIYSKGELLPSITSYHQEDKCELCNNLTLNKIKDNFVCEKCSKEIPDELK